MAPGEGLEGVDITIRGPLGQQGITGGLQRSRSPSKKIHGSLLLKPARRPCPQINGDDRATGQARDLRADPGCRNIGSAHPGHPGKDVKLNASFPKINLRAHHRRFHAKDAGRDQAGKTGNRRLRGRKAPGQRVSCRRRKV
jgi:hypothetical protein